MRSILFCVLGGAVLGGISSCIPGGGANSGLAVGQDAPEINPAGWVNGPAPTGEKLAGKVIVVDAWASW
ncbi:MAG: hypothetical protein IID45_15170 [Planctomycetes bacterium]|nr:hypothetical protein [Planctomycetota bacterium]